MFRRPSCEGVVTDYMQMKGVTTCGRFITLLQERFAVSLNCATSGTKECRRPVTRESWFRFAGGHFRRGYNLFGTELFRLSRLVFSSGRSVAATASPRLSLILFSYFTDCHFLSPSWLWLLTFWSVHFQGCRTCTGQHNVNICWHASFLSSRFEPTITELDKSKTARL